MIAQDVVQPSETILSLSSRLTGDPQGWRALVALNSLRAPYLAAEAAPGVLAPGDTVLYPATERQTVAPLGVSELEALTYKRDLTAQGGDLLFSGATPVILGGLDNLGAALSRRLRHALGSHPFHPTTWGSLLPGQLGTVADEARLSILRSDVRRALLADPRVASVEVGLVWEDDLLEATVEVTPIPPGSRFTLTLRL